MQTTTQRHDIDLRTRFRLFKFNVGTYVICLLFVVTTFGQSGSPRHSTDTIYQLPLNS